MNITIPVNVVLPVSDKLIRELIDADTINGKHGKHLIYISEEGGEGYSTSMWLGFYQSYGNYLTPAEETYSGIIIRYINRNDMEAILLS